MSLATGGVVLLGATLAWTGPAPGSSSIALAEHDVVACASGSCALGYAKWVTNYTSVDRDGTQRFTAEFRFASEDNMLAFENGPFGFAPRYGGFDGWALAQMGAGEAGSHSPGLPWSRDRLGPPVDVTSASAWAMVPGANGLPSALHVFANASSAAGFVKGLPGTREAADAVWARWWGEHGTVPPFALSAGPFNTVCFIKDAGAGHPARDCSTAPQPLPPADFLAADVGTGNPGGMPFVTRSGAGLEVNGDRFVAVGPNCYWLGLDENVPANGSNVQYPTHFRVDDIFATAVEMGATTIRAHTLGVSTGNLKSFEPVEAVFDEHVAHGNDTSSASEHIDYAVYRARTSGIRLIIPLTDNYGYYHGGKHNFVEWASPNDPDLAFCRLPLNVHEPSATRCPFYTNPQVIAAFKAYIGRLLNHTNQYTGIALKHEPAILGWETGNELNGVPAAWTAEIAAYIKAELGAQQLVLDGIDSERLGGVARLAPDELTADHVDLYTDHFYPPNPAMVAASAAAALAAGKVYYVGEYEWVAPGLPAFLETLETTKGVSGSLYWSLFPHADTHGFVGHNDGNTLNYPGIDEGQLVAAAALRSHAFKMRGIPVPTHLPPATQPLITLADHGRVAWRGVANALKYSVQRGPTATGPWTTVCDRCVTDAELPWRDPNSTACPHAVYYRAQPHGIPDVGPPAKGASGPWSEPAASSCAPTPPPAPPAPPAPPGPPAPPASCTFEPGADWTGGESGAAMRRVPTTQACCNLCAQANKLRPGRCVHAAYNTGDGGCWMKTLGSNQVKKPAGIVGCTPKA